MERSPWVFAFFQPSLLLSNALNPTFFIERRMLIRWY